MQPSLLASLRDVGVAYGKRTVLHNISLDVVEGDFWTIIGPNGAGKSTLLGLFNGMTAACSGEVRYAGQVLGKQTLARARLEIAHVFQAADLDPKMPLSVLEAVLGGTYARTGLFRRPGARERELARQALDAVGLSHLISRPVGHLSGGERQRTALARALAQEPRLLLLDEPTAALDWQAQREILNTIEHLRRTMRLTVIMVTHDLNAVCSLSQKVGMLKNGHFLWQGTADEAMREELLAALYGVPIQIAQCHGRKAALF